MWGVAFHVDENDAIGPLARRWQCRFSKTVPFLYIDIEVGQEVVVIAVVQHGSVYTAYSMSPRR
jgi:hypothetical protein